MNPAYCLLYFRGMRASGGAIHAISTDTYTLGTVLTLDDKHTHTYTRNLVLRQDACPVSLPLMHLTHGRNDCRAHG